MTMKYINVTFKNINKYIREATLIKPITIAGIDNKISLYADDIGVFVSNPEQFAPRVREIINSFSAASGYITWQKSDFISHSADLEPGLCPPLNLIHLQK